MFRHRLAASNYKTVIPVTLPAPWNPQYFLTLSTSSPVPLPIVSYILISPPLPHSPH